MTLLAVLTVAAMIAAPLSALAQSPQTADVVFLGETHDNPDHHRAQAAFVRDHGPFAALVVEMLTPAQAAAANAWRAEGGDAEGLGDAVEWSSSWPDYQLYAPVFNAAPNARIYGAWLTRARLFAAADSGAASLFAPSDAARLGLTTPLPPNQQTAREQMQIAAHCGMLPASVAPRLVDAQRARDAVLALAIEQAAAQGRVAVITGLGHARKDWGAPVYLARIAPDLSVWSVGFVEPGAAFPGGVFDAIETFAPPPDRPDPCAAFTQ